MYTNKKITYIILCFACFTLSFNVAAVAAIVPEIAKYFHLNNHIVAKVIPYYLIPYGLAALIYAPLTRYVQMRVVLCVSLLLFGLGCFLCAVAQNLGMLLTGRVIMGIAGSGIIPLGLMIIGDLYEKNIRGRLVGFFFGNAFTASIAGLLVGQKCSWQLIFFIPSIMAGIMVLYLAWDRSLLNYSHKGAINYLKTFQNVRIRNIFMFIFALSACYHAVHKWYGVYLSEVYGFDNARINGFIIITVVAGFLGQTTGGVLTDKKGRRFACFAGIIGLGLAVMALYREYTPFILGAVLFLISFFWTTGHNGLSTTLTDFPDEDRPAIASLNSSIRFISGGLGFSLSAYFVAKSFSLTFFVIGILILLLNIVLTFIIPKDT